MDEPARTNRIFKWTTGAALLAFIALAAFRSGFELEPLAQTAALAAWLACWRIAFLRAPVKLRSYVALASLSATVGLLLWCFRGEAAWLAAVFWGASTLLGLIWCVFYERSRSQRPQGRA